MSEEYICDERPHAVAVYRGPKRVNILEPNSVSLLYCSFEEISPKKWVVNHEAVSLARDG